ncbi:MAG: hypothetical protein CVT92_15245 [Bacteroidetes bacterium HGW-Bacteroidetes-1]|jgi:hypothetical protein|nr:MAG: hypothetical protein CVT92_15245 [Bacteroidetes bacterium HGW-Bacteroidetes-1]
MPIDWNQIVTEAANATDEHFANQISSITRFNDTEINQLILDTGISQQDLASTLKEVKDTTKSNESKAIAIGNIEKGVDVLIAIAARLM